VVAVATALLLLGNITGGDQVVDDGEPLRSVMLSVKAMFAWADAACTVLPSYV